MFQIQFNSNYNKFNVDFVQKQSFDLSFNKEYITRTTLPTYDGEYVIEPTSQQQVLNTANKAMTDDLTIKRIPYAETTNDKGGTTLYIGKVG